MANMSKLLTSGALGAAAAYFLDPDQGARRRNVTRDWTMARLRRGAEQAQGKLEYTRDVAQGAVHQAKEATPTGGGDKEQPDDVTLARKVESIVFRDADAPKDRVSVNAENGVVYLRGELDSSGQVEGLIKAVGDVEGVRGVESLLHLPGEAAPSKQ